MFKRRKSGLATFELLSPNNTSPRKNNISRLTPHNVAGKATANVILGLSGFRSGGGASCTYAIGYDGSIGLGVPEYNAPWTSSSSTNDNRAITSELSNSGGAPDWRIGDETINAWLDLSFDICQFYGYKKVNYQVKPDNIKGTTDVESWIKTWAKSDEMIITLHNWYVATACPGPYFTRQIPWLVKELNKRLSDPNYIWEKFVGEGATYATVKIGNKGDDVRLLQERLNVHGCEPALLTDGIFGLNTKDAVTDFQYDNELAVDGIVGPVTWALLLKEPKGEDPKPVAPDPVPTPEPDISEYVVRINVPALNVRTGPGTTYPVATTLVNDKNAYTIVEEAAGPGASMWGRLKSGAGWIALNYTSKI